MAWTFGAFLLASAAWATPELVNPCFKTPFKEMPFCDVRLPLEARVSDAVGRMSVAEKISALGTSTPAIPSLNLPAYNWWSEATSGVATVRDTKTTKFPFPITTGMSFNRSLWKQLGGQIGREARAAMNAGNAYSTYWTPVVNLARDPRMQEVDPRVRVGGGLNAEEPRWGRNIETPGHFARFLRVSAHGLGP